MLKETFKIITTVCYAEYTNYGRYGKWYDHPSLAQNLINDLPLKY